MSHNDFESASRDETDSNNYNNEPPEESGGSFAKELVNTLIYIIILTGIFLLIQHFFFVPVTVEGDSMEPTLSQSDRLMLNKVRDIDRFDIVVFPAPDDPERQYIKRVIGVPGDEITYNQDQLYVNGEEVHEPYLEEYNEQLNFNTNVTGDFDLESLFGIQEVPEDSYFVLGDNRLNSRDSRSFGFVDADTITGETKFQIWPLDDIGYVYE